MTVFLILLPYAAFALLMLTAPADVALFTGAGICMAVIAYDVLRGRSVKILGAGSALVFVAVGGYVTEIDPDLSVSGVKLAVDAGMLLVTLGSIAALKPFTLQYAREVVDAETAKLPGFIKANYLITAVWALAMLLMMAGNAALIYMPGLPLWSGLLVAFAARNSAVYFTKWYPEYRKSRYGAPPAGALPES